MRFSALIVVGVLLAYSPLHADCSHDTFHNEQNQRDFEAVQEYVNSKRTMPLAEKKEWLKITGDVKFEYFNKAESQDHKQLRGHGAVDRKGIRIPHETYEVQADLFATYKCDKTYAKAQLTFDNDAGIFDSHHNPKNDPNGLFGSGFCDDICLKQAYWGWDFLSLCDVHEFNVEVGHRRLYQMFESRIEFNAYGDGVLLEYDRLFIPPSGDRWKIYAKALGFVVDERINYFAYVTEVGALDFMNTKIDAIYSFIDWSTRHRNRAGTKDPLGHQFRVNQVSLAYNFKMDWCKKGRLYGAFLWNSAARKEIEVVEPDPAVIKGRENLGWYAGFIIGDVQKRGDWSLDVNYQVVQAQAIPDLDVHGIGRGNIAKETFTANRRGKTNYKGWHVEALYQISDAIYIDPQYDFSWAANPKIGGAHHYSSFEVDFVVEF